MEFKNRCSLHFLQEKDKDRTDKKEEKSETPVIEKEPTTEEQITEEVAVPEPAPATSINDADDNAKASGEKEMKQE